MPNLGDIGTIFRKTIKDQDGVVVNISTATTKELIFTKPDGTQLTKTAVYTTDGTDGKIQYVAVAGDLDLEGKWGYHGHVIIPGGNGGDWESTRTPFVVSE
jgi:hypothetical protein